MTTYRSQVIREVETDLAQARARGMIRTPKYAGQSYHEWKAEQRRKQMKVYQAIFLALVLVIGAAYLFAKWMVG